MSKQLGIAQETVEEITNFLGSKVDHSTNFSLMFFTKTGVLHENGLDEVRVQQISSVEPEYLRPAVIAAFQIHPDVRMNLEEVKENPRQKLLSEINNHFEGEYLGKFVEYLKLSQKWIQNKGLDSNEETRYFDLQTELQESFLLS